MVFGLKRKDSRSETSVMSARAPSFERRRNALSSPAKPPPTTATRAFPLVVMATPFVDFARPASPPAGSAASERTRNRAAGNYGPARAEPRLAFGGATERQASKRNLPP